MQGLAEAKMATHSQGASVRRRTMLAAAIAAVGLACAPQAHADDGQPVDLQVVDRQTGRPLQVWRHDGKLFVAGAPGARYGLRVTNNTGARVLLVMSVDGVNILSGETAGYDQRGYIFGPHESYEIDGWRKSLTEIADFTFTRLSQSYAAETGRPANVGVIGVAMFEERVAPVAVAPPPPQPHAEPEDRDADRANRMGRALAQNVPPSLPMPEAPPPPPPSSRAAGADSVSEMVVAAQRRQAREQAVPAAVSAYASRQRDVVEAQRQDERLGTGHGAHEESVMTIEPFDRETDDPQFTQEIAYDTRDHLVAQGVIPTWRGEPHPRPFPSSPPDEGFVPDPPGGF
jgi:hypothetical protein